MGVDIMNESILGYSVNTCSVDDCAEAVMSCLGSEDASTNCFWMACLNPHSYAIALKDSIFAAALQDAQWLIPDGVGIVWASRVKGGRVRKRVTGSDIFFCLNQRMNAKGGLSVFFFGCDRRDSIQDS